MLFQVKLIKEKLMYKILSCLFLICASQANMWDEARGCNQAPPKGAYNFGKYSPMEVAYRFIDLQPCNDITYNQRILDPMAEKVGKISDLLALEKSYAIPTQDGESSSKKAEIRVRLLGKLAEAEEFVKYLKINVYRLYLGMTHIKTLNLTDSAVYLEHFNTALGITVKYLNMYGAFIKKFERHYPTEHAEIIRENMNRALAASNAPADSSVRR